MITLIDDKGIKVEMWIRHVLPLGTDCGIRIYLDDELKAAGTGYTTVHTDDQYSRPKGRKLAFARAVQDTVWNRGGHGLGARRQLWDAYFKRFPKDRR